MKGLEAVSTDQRQTCEPWVEKKRAWDKALLPHDKKTIRIVQPLQWIKNPPGRTIISHTSQLDFKHNSFSYIQPLMQQNITPTRWNFWNLTAIHLCSHSRNKELHQLVKGLLNFTKKPWIRKGWAMIALTQVRVEWVRVTTWKLGQTANDIVLTAQDIPINSLLVNESQVPEELLEKRDQQFGEWWKMYVITHWGTRRRKGWKLDKPSNLPRPRTCSTRQQPSPDAHKSLLRTRRPISGVATTTAHTAPPIVGQHKRRSWCQRVQNEAYRNTVLLFWRILLERGLTSSSERGLSSRTTSGHPLTFNWSSCRKEVERNWSSCYSCTKGDTKRNSETKSRSFWRRRKLELYQIRV